jgi:hypothetical protein
MEAAEAREQQNEETRELEAEEAREELVASGYGGNVSLNGISQLDSPQPTTELLDELAAHCAAELANRDAGVAEDTGAGLVQTAIYRNLVPAPSQGYQEEGGVGLSQYDEQLGLLLAQELQQQAQQQALSQQQQHQNHQQQQQQGYGPDAALAAGLASTLQQQQHQAAMHAAAAAYALQQAAGVPGLGGVAPHLNTAVNDLHFTPAGSA